MPFATPQEMADALGSNVLTDIADDNQDGQWDPTVVSGALDEASSIAESYVYSYMPLPFTPTMLRRATISIAAQLIRQPRNRSTLDSTKAYEDALTWLRDIAKGTAQLVPPTPEPGAPEQLDPGDPIMVSSARVWSRSSGRGVF